ncbi:MAG: PrsW family intramembrane metalloprotease [Bacteroidales bacterium]|nr:PrsW family intramembrane metalloprotease [Bacteroidales bacterium]
MKIVISLIPVLLFLGLLLFFDSFRLINRWVLIICLLWGVVAASLSLVGNTLLASSFSLSFDILSRYVAPFTEEILKMLILIFLISRHRIGFAIDAAIYGFAVGSGFAFTENLIYLLQLGSEQSNLWIWISRGVGTAVMHGGASAIAGVILVNRLTDSRNLFQPLLLAVVIAYLIHALYNAFLISPLFSALVVIIIVPVMLVIVFRMGERNLKRWLDVNMDAEVGLLLMINHGKFSKTRAGAYLLSIKDHFPKEVVVDMYCFMTLYLELSVKAKSLLLLKENDLPLPMDPHIMDKLHELDQLRKQIGKSGILALRPVLRMNRSDLWALSILKPD